MNHLWSLYPWETAQRLISEEGIHQSITDPPTCPLWHPWPSEGDDALGIQILDHIYWWQIMFCVHLPHENQGPGTGHIQAIQGIGGELDWQDYQDTARWQGRQIHFQGFWHIDSILWHLQTEDHTGHTSAKWSCRAFQLHTGGGDHYHATWCTPPSHILGWSRYDICWSPQLLSHLCPPLSDSFWILAWLQTFCWSLQSLWFHSICACSQGQMTPPRVTHHQMCHDWLCSRY